MEEFLIYSGKVRNIYSLGDDYLIMIATDKVSSFDRHIGTIPGKGKLLNKMSKFWFEQTKHIIDNHLISTQDNVALVHKCTPIMIEVVVRGYITGTTSTSLWTHYNKGSRAYCGIIFPDGLKKNQKLDCPVITPTTKGKVDIPIAKENLIQEGYMTENECNYVFEKALELFEFGQKLADKADLILVDTKYEFGKDQSGKIILIDELHTCDSSRYWKKSTYEEKFKQGLEPDKYDKDCIRDWVKTKCDPYKDAIPEIPEYIVWKALNCYQEFYDTLVGETPKPPLATLPKLNADRDMGGVGVVGETPKPPLATLPKLNDDRDVGGLGVSPTPTPTLVIILYGSEKDKNFIDKIVKALKEHKLAYLLLMASAHKNTQQILDLINECEERDMKLVWITVAGRSNALSGVVAANSKYPVIACPPFADKMDMMVNINSTLQCPSNVPVMTILEPGNVALAIKRIVDL